MTTSKTAARRGAAKKGQAPQRERRVAKALKVAKAKGLLPPKATTAPKSSGRGRPTTYRPEYAEYLIKCCGAGMSYETFCAQLEITHQRMSDWAKANPDFREAIGIAKMKLASYLELEARASTNGPFIGMRLRSLSQLAPDTWREHRTVGIGGVEDAGPVKVLAADDAMARYMAAKDAVNAAVASAWDGRARN